MKHLVIVAHPVKEQFHDGADARLHRTVEQLGHSQRTYDLYRMGFDRC